MSFISYFSLATDAQNMFHRVKRFYYIYTTGGNKSVAGFSATPAIKVVFMIWMLKAY